MRMARMGSPWREWRTDREPSCREKVKGYPRGVFRIAEFARLGGVSARMLRAWDALGLFHPVWVDPLTGYRRYSPAQLPELRRILALRDVGVPLEEVARLVAGGADLRAVLDRRREHLEAERREIERRLQALDITVAMAGEVSAVDGWPARRDAAERLQDVVVRPVPAEPVATLAVDPASDDLGPAFYELETYVRDRGRRAARPPGSVEGSGPTGGDAEGSDATGDRAPMVFVPVTGPVEPRGPAEPRGAIGYRRLPACRAASIIHRGSYSGLAGARDALDRWVRGVGLVPAGPLRVLYLQFGAEPELRVPRAWLVERDADLVTELQQPVA
jgi:DNA-binding transcriptional MerR regulator